VIVNGSSSTLSYRINSSASLSQKQSLDSNKQSDQEDSDLNASSNKDEGVEQSSIAEQQQLQQLKNRDREVRAHELAHTSAGGRYTSSAQFSYQKGSDGKLYAVGGEVSIDTSTVPGDPKATLLKAQVIVRAALAPANPSAQDRNVAAQATAVIQQARVDLAAILAETSETNPGQQVDTFA